MKDDKRLKNQKKEKKSELSRQELYQIDIKKTPHPKIENSSEMNIEK